MLSNTLMVLYGYIAISLVAWVILLISWGIHHYYISKDTDLKFGAPFVRGVPTKYTLFFSLVAFPFTNLFYLYIIIAGIPSERRWRKEKKLRNGRYLFLDIDGVFNTEKTYLAYQRVPNASNKDAFRLFNSTDLAFFETLTRLGVKIVLSSTWRRQSDRTLEQIGRQLGVELYGATPQDVGEHSYRGHEIKQWFIDNNIEPKSVSYLIVDDETDGMTFQQKRNLIKVDPKEGLTTDHYKRILKHFGLAGDIYE